MCRFLQRQDIPPRLTFARCHPAQPTRSRYLHDSGACASRCSVCIHVAATPRTTLEIGPFPSSTQPQTTRAHTNWIYTSTPFYDNLDRQRLPLCPPSPPFIAHTARPLKLCDHTADITSQLPSTRSYYPYSTTVIVQYCTDPLIRKSAASKSAIHNTRGKIINWCYSEYLLNGYHSRCLSSVVRGRSLRCRARKRCFAVSVRCFYVLGEGAEGGPATVCTAPPFFFLRPRPPCSRRSFERLRGTHQSVDQSSYSVSAAIYERGPRFNQPQPHCTTDPTLRIVGAQC